MMNDILTETDYHSGGEVHWSQAVMSDWNSSTCRVISYSSYFSRICCVAAVRTCRGREKIYRS